MGNQIRQSSTFNGGQWIEPRQIRGEQSTLIDQLFARLEAMYPQRWRASFPSGAAIEAWRETWSDAFDEEKVSPQDVGDAVRACRRKYDWPPSLTEFLKLCKPAMDPESAYVEACKQISARDNGSDTWSNPAIYWAAREYGVHELRQSTWASAKMRWCRVLEEQLAKPEQLPVPARMAALPEPGAGTADPAKVAAALETLRAALKSRQQITEGGE
jgi:hypothetical protein